MNFNGKLGLVICGITMAFVLCAIVEESSAVAVKDVSFSKYILLKLLIFFDNNLKMYLKGGKTTNI